MVAGSELTRLIDRVVRDGEALTPVIGDERRWCVQRHREIARRGIEAGLRLALRLLYEHAATEGRTPQLSGSTAISTVFRRRRRSAASAVRVNRGAKHVQA